MSNADRSDHNSQEKAVLEWLVERIQCRLADRGGGRHEPGWEPRHNVVVGVLDPVIAAPVEGGANEPEGTLIVPEVESLPTLGLDFRVRSAQSTLDLRVAVDLAIYLEEYPTRQEQLAYETPEQVSPPKNDQGESIEGVPAAEDNPDAQSSTAAEDDPDTHSAPPGSSTEDSSGGVRRRRRTTRLACVWTRWDVSADDISISVPLTGEVVEGGQPLREAIGEAIHTHFSEPCAAREFSERTRTLPASALEDDAAFDRALRAAEDSGFAPTSPHITLNAFAERIEGQEFLVSVSLTNATVLPERPFQDLTIYDCRLRVSVDEASEIVPQRFSLAPADYRYEDVSRTVGHGRGCVAVQTNGSIASTSFPVFPQLSVIPRHDHVPAARWSELAEAPDAVLLATRNAMQKYLGEWDEFLSGASVRVQAAARAERDQFADELRRFELGMAALDLDARLRSAFKLANKAFDTLNSDKPYDSWRLFQFVYLVTHLPALAAREHRDHSDLKPELWEFADVLWFPTGGGKTEAYLGLIIVALYYDRLRGKARGSTAWLKFPLRMLSVQQLVRVLKILAVADELRVSELGDIGDPFLLGYLVGSSNTPNNLLYPRSWWPGFDKADSLDQEELDRHRLVAQCPYCGANEVHLRVDMEHVRLLHTCSACGRDLPLAMSDDEVFRYMPSVIIWTVDKLSGFAWFGEFTQFIHGPRFRCPDHGWFTFPRNKKCLAGRLCKRTKRHYTEADAWYDPGPSLIVQDEMHLLKEELGAFDAHYEGLLTELLRRGPGGLPAKILGASATIEQYEDQLRQVYGRKPRSFPSPGFDRKTTFYAIETPDLRRLYLGVLPHYRRKADVAGMIQAELLTAVSGLQDKLEEAGEELGLAQLQASELRALTDAYEVSLSYVNSKIHGDQIADELTRLSEAMEGRGSDPVAFAVLTGQVSVPELADAIERVETPAQGRGNRLRALVGTSVVSHGVDLERLNVMIMAGLPTTIANYIQASSRSGRTHAGLVVTVCDSFSRRERSAFSNFLSFHRFLDRMVEPVPVNKYALFGANRTLPGIVLAHLWDLCRDQALSPPEEGIRRSRSLAHWWQAQSAQLKTHLEERIRATYGSLIPGVNDDSLEQDLIDRVVERWTNVELGQMQQFDQDSSYQLFRERVLSSFRDIDAPVEFTALPLSEDAFLALTGYGVEDLDDPNESTSDDPTAEGSN